MTKIYLYPSMKQGKLYKIYWPNVIWSIKQFKMSRGSAYRFPLVVLWTGGKGTSGTSNSAFRGLISIFLPILIINTIILSADHWFNACTVIVRSENFRTGLFASSQSFFFLSNQQLLDFFLFKNIFKGLLNYFIFNYT